MLKVDNSETLSAVCRVWLKNHISENTFHASVCEAARAGVDWRAVLSEAGVDPASLPRPKMPADAEEFAAAMVAAGKVDVEVLDK